MKRPWQLWLDRRGRFSMLRVVVLALLLIPLAKGIYDVSAIVHGARPINELIHRAGFWALVFLGITLAVTPFRRIARYGNLVDVRRMLGVGAFCYIAAHLSLYLADQNFDIGIAGTSSSEARLGSGLRRWQRHRPTARCGGWAGCAGADCISSFMRSRCSRLSIISSRLKRMSRCRPSPQACSAG